MCVIFRLWGYLMMTKTRIWAVEIVTRMSPNVGEIGTWLWGHDGGHSPH